MTLADLLILAFATWRLGDILITEDGPWQIVHKFRLVIVPMYIHSELEVLVIDEDTMLGQLFSCIRCMSVWTGAFWMLAWLVIPTPWIYLFALPFAFSGLAILIDTAVYKG